MLEFIVWASHDMSSGFQWVQSYMDSVAKFGALGSAPVDEMGSLDSEIIHNPAALY